MAGAGLRAALEQRLGALAIRTEVVEHPEVRCFCRDSPAGRVGSAAAFLGLGREAQMPQR